MPREPVQCPNVTEGPRSGPQPDVIYCPRCGAHLRSVPSTREPAATSHNYECEHGHVWEINEQGRRQPRDWNGSRPMWEAPPACE